MDFSGSGIYKEALTNIKIVIFKESYPEDKLIEDNLSSSILEELGRVLRGTPTELPHLKSSRLEGGALIYIYILQRTVWSMACQSH
jgi:hypothetical protein